MALFKNSANLTVGYNVNTPCPIDCRTVLEYHTDLINAATWSGLGNSLYTGLVSYVKEDSSLYILISSNPTSGLVNLTTATEAQKEAAYKMWVKLATSSSIDALAGIFAFKGVAEAVSPDLSYVVTCQDSEGDTLSPIGTAADFEGDVYYGWQIDDQQIWTDSLVLNSASTQYTRGEGTVVKCVVYNDVYYFTTEQVTDDKTILESISGHQIKISTNDLQTTAPGRIDVYDGEITGDGYIIEYTAYSFTIIPTNDTVDVHHNHTIIYASDGTKLVDGTTIPDNSGHVYQIGENEYASNGQIWVKLGSPVEDWIII